MKLGIGTVQFGLDYGLSNQEGKTSPEEVVKILDVAAQNGVRIIDTAALYGASEEILGKSLPLNHRFAIVTKTPQFSKKSLNSNDAQLLENIFHRSLEQMKQTSLYGLLVHRVEDLFAKNGHLLIKRMIELKQRGLVEKVGVSVYTGQQIDRVTESYPIDLIQVPVNVLDQRLLLSGHFSKLKKAGIEIHARSVFLQGLLLMEVESVRSFFDPIKPVLYEYRTFLNSKGLTLVEGAIAFIKQVSEIDCMIIGINDIKQLKTNLNSFTRSYNDSLFTEFRKFSLNEAKYLDPPLWCSQ